MSDIMLLGVLRMPLPDNPAEVSILEWPQIVSRMREAADAVEQRDAEIERLRSAHDARVAELLESNNALLDRARKAEAMAEKLAEALGPFADETRQGIADYEWRRAHEALAEYDAAIRKGAQE